MAFNQVHVLLGKLTLFVATCIITSLLIISHNYIIVISLLSHAHTLPYDPFLITTLLFFVIQLS